jgi:Subtilase family
MNHSSHRPLRDATLAAAAIAAALCPGALWPAVPAADAAAATAGEYEPVPVCGAPVPGHAGCLAMAPAPRTASARARARAHGAAPQSVVGMSSSAAACASEFPACLTPADLNDAYFPGEPPATPASEPQTIALVDADNDPEARSDLEAYEAAFGLDRCPAAQSSCFEQVNQDGETTNLPFPASEAARETELAVCENPHRSRSTREQACINVEEADDWAVEISTDIEVTRAICQNCKVLLVEAATTSYANLEQAEETAVKLEATEISNSWGGAEPALDSPAFDHPGLPITAAAGDGGYLDWEEAQATEAGEASKAGPDYPASSPHVIAVGGTRLTLSGGAWQDETVWNDGGEGLGAGGSGCSRQFEAESWQRAVPDWSQVGCENRRAVADVSADGDPDSGVAVYDSVPDLREENKEVIDTPLYWWPIGGTSVASPIIASMFALAGGAHGVEYPAKTLYAHLGTNLLHDVTVGGNGECDDTYTAGCTGSMSPLSSRFAYDCGEGVLICNTGPGYDGPSGVGTPAGVGALSPESEAEHTARLEAQRAAEQRAAEEQAQKTAERKTEEERKLAEAQREIERQEELARNTTSTGTGTGKGNEETLPPSQTTTGSPSPPAVSSPPAPSMPQSTQAPVLSALALTKTATAALSHSQPHAAQVAFTFTLSRGVSVRVILTQALVVHGHARWRTLPYALTLAGTEGRNGAHLGAHAHLAPGRYRLTLTPAGGSARTLTFRVG